MNLVIILSSYFTDFKDNLALNLTCKKYHDIFKMLTESDRNNYGNKKIDSITNKFTYFDSVKILYNSICDKLKMSTEEEKLYNLNFDKDSIKNLNNGVYMTYYYNNHTFSSVDLKKIRIVDFFYKSNLNLLNLSNVSITNSKFIQTSLKRCLALFSKFSETIFYNCKLNDSSFHNCNFFGTSFWASDMKNIKFNFCNFYNSNFQYPDLKKEFRTNLEGSEIKFSDLSYCKFSVIDFPWKESLINDNGNSTTISYYLQNNYRESVQGIVMEYIGKIWGPLIEKNIKENKTVDIKVPPEFKDFLTISDPDNGWVWVTNDFYTEHLNTDIFESKPYDATFETYIRKIVENNSSLFDWILSDLNNCTINILKEIILQTFNQYLRPNLNNINLEGSIIYKSYFMGCDMKNSKLINISVLSDRNENNNKKVNLLNSTTDSSYECQVTFSSFKKYNAVFVRANLERSNLSHSNFTCTIFSEANITKSNCINCVFKDCLFYNSKLNGTDFSYSKFTNANFHFADLRNCNFTGADLTNVDFTGANLSGANFTNAILDQTILKIIFPGFVHQVLAPDFDFEQRGMSGHQVPAGEPSMINTIDLEIKLQGAKGLNNLYNRGAIMKHNSGEYYKWNDNCTNLEKCIVHSKK